MELTISKKTMSSFVTRLNRLDAMNMVLIDSLYPVHPCVCLTPTVTHDRPQATLHRTQSQLSWLFRPTSPSILPAPTQPTCSTQSYPTLPMAISTHYKPTKTFHLSCFSVVVSALWKIRDTASLCIGLCSIALVSNIAFCQNSTQDRERHLFYMQSLKQVGLDRTCTRSYWWMGQR